MHAFFIRGHHIQQAVAVEIAHFKLRAHAGIVVNFVQTVLEFPRFRPFQFQPAQDGRFVAAGIVAAMA